MTDNNSIITRASSEDTTVTNMVLHITNNSSFRNGPNGQNITHNKVGLFAAVDKLTRVQTFGGHEKLLLFLVPKRVSERDLRQWGPTTRVVDYVGDHAFEVAISLAEVEAAKPGWALAVVCVGFEDGACSLTLGSDYSPHFGDFLVPQAWMELGFCF